MLLCLLFILVGSLPSSAGETRGQFLLQHLVKEFSPEKITMVVDDEPDETGYIRDMYLDITGCIIGGVRIDSLQLRAMGVRLTPPSEWNEKGLVASEILNILAFAKITEKDLNDNLFSKNFGDDDHWNNLQVDMRSDGIYARGNYLVRVLFRLNILIEIFSKCKVVDMQQIWLDDYTLKVNKVDVPNFITDKAVKQIQPILDLSKFVFPLKLHSIGYGDDSITLSSRVLPTSFDGIVYEFTEHTARKK